jgi:hypothetical protein
MDTIELPFKNLIDTFGTQKEFGEFVRTNGLDISNSLISQYYLGNKYPPVPTAILLLEVIKIISKDKKIKIKLNDLILPPKRKRELNKLIKSTLRSESGMDRRKNHGTSKYNNK